MKSTTQKKQAELIAEYAEIIFANVKFHLHDGVKVYLDEEPLTRCLAQCLTDQGWPSKGGHVRYPSGARRADIVTEHQRYLLTITNETKYLVCDYPGAKKGRGAWKGIGGTIPAKHLGIEPGKSINAVDDVSKLDQADTTHVSFLLVRMESLERSGDAAVKTFTCMAGLNKRRWIRFDAHWDWVHPKSQDHVIKCNLWCRTHKSAKKAGGVE